VKPALRTTLSTLFDLYCLHPAVSATVFSIERQEMTTLINVSASDLRKAADIKEQIEALQAQLNECLGGGYVGNGLAPSPSQLSPRRGRKPKGGKSVVDCVLEVLNSGNVMSIQDILGASSKIRGKDISRGLMSVTLAYLKKKKRIANPARGQYRKL
jgi:hypothetical protein